MNWLWIYLGLSVAWVVVYVFHTVATDQKPQGSVFFFGIIASPLVWLIMVVALAAFAIKERAR